MIKRKSIEDKVGSFCICNTVIKIANMRPKHTFTIFLCEKVVK